MAEPIRTQLIPVDASKQYHQWGRVAVPATLTTPEQIEWTVQRQFDSTRFRETHGGFENEVVYEIEILVPGFPAPFKSTAMGAQLNMGEPNSERQANYAFAQIGQLPLYFKLTPVPDPVPTPS